MVWTNDQDFEKDWWGDCANTLGEENKQLTYAKLMGLRFFHNGKSPHNLNLEGKKVLDIGSGPISMLLKCIDCKGCIAADPCDYPSWVQDRYKLHGVTYLKSKGEDLNKLKTVFDEVWIYNVLQHVDDVKKIVDNALKCSKIIRIFEWIDTGTTPGHPNNLTQVWLDGLLKGEGKVSILNEPTLRGKCYYGVFKGEYYEKI